MADFGLMGRALAVAAMAAGFVQLAFAWLGRGGSRLRETAGSLGGLAAGIYAGCGLLGEWPRLPPLEDRDRFLVVLLPLALVAEGVAANARSSWLTRVLRWGVAVTAAPILLYRSSYLADLDGPGSAEWSAGTAAAIFAVLAICLAGLGEQMGHCARRTSRPAVAAALTLTLLAAGVTVMLSGYYRGGLFALPIAGAVAGASSAACTLPQRRQVPQPANDSLSPAASGAVPVDSGPAVAIGLVGLFSVLVMGRFFGALSTVAMLGLAAAPVMMWAALLPPFHKLPPWVRGLVAVAAVVLPLVAIVVQAQANFTAAFAAGSRPGDMPGGQQLTP